VVDLLYQFFVGQWLFVDLRRFDFRRCCLLHAKA